MPLAQTFVVGANGIPSAFNQKFLTQLKIRMRYKIRFHLVRSSSIHLEFRGNTYEVKFGTLLHLTPDNIAVAKHLPFVEYHPVQSFQTIKSTDFHQIHTIHRRCKFRVFANKNTPSTDLCDW